jgi:hypothetical protein
MEKNKCGNRYSPEVRELAEIYQILGCHRRKNVRLLGECGFMGVPDHLQSETFGNVESCPKPQDRILLEIMSAHPS